MNAEIDKSGRKGVSRGEKKIASTIGSMGGKQERIDPSTGGEKSPITWGGH